MRGKGVSAHGCSVVMLALKGKEKGVRPEKEMESWLFSSWMLGRGEYFKMYTGV